MSYSETVTNDDDDAPPQGNLWKWIGIMALITIVFAIGRWMSGGPSIIGDALAFAGMILGGLVMIQSQREFHRAGMGSNTEV